MQKRLAKQFPCASEFAVAVLVGKWNDHSLLFERAVVPLC